MEWFYWFRAAQHEWWFIPAGVGVVLLILGVVLCARIAWGRFWGWLMSPSMKGTEDQVEAQWATPDDLERFGLVQPRKGFGKWTKTAR